jgi:DNA-binding transcriptional LysR family regulator
MGKVRAPAALFLSKKIAAPFVIMLILLNQTLRINSPFPLKMEYFMELLQLRHFCTVAKLESITRAAETLNVSQPSISKTIINLETELGGPLFDRIGRHITLNSRGKIFYEKILDALYMIDNAYNHADELTENPYGKINLLILAASKFAPELIGGFLKKYPHIRVNLRQWYHYNLGYSGEFDFSISATPMDYSQHNYIPLLTEEIVLVVSSAHPLASMKVIDLKTAEPYEFVVISPGPSIRTLTDSLCYLAGFTPRIRCECDNIDTLIPMITDGLCVALMAQDTLFKYYDAGLTALSLSNSGAKRTVNLAWRKDKYFSKACSLFKDYCISYFRNGFTR